jgi:3D (Asp-Asp-Asp) domain-containing protein
LRRLLACCSPLLAALAGGVLLSASLPASGAADTAPGLRAQVVAEREALQAMRRTEHGALLALYAAESTLARAHATQRQLEARSRALAREEESLRRRTAVVGRSLTATEARVAAILRQLYVDGAPDPLAAMLGASSLDEALTVIDSFEYAAALNQRLAAEARRKTVRLRGLRATLTARRDRLDAARDAADAAAAASARAVAERRVAVDALRRRSAGTAARLDALLAQAQAAERASRRIEERLAGTPAEEQAPVTAAAAPATPPPTAAGNGVRTLTVDAVAYHLPGRTASGLPVGPGVVAVDPRVIPLGTRMFIPGYGPGIAADTGSAIKGNIIDLWMPSTAAARRWGRRTVTITIYG